MRGMAGLMKVAAFGSVPVRLRILIICEQSLKIRARGSATHLRLWPLIRRVTEFLKRVTAHGLWEVSVLSLLLAPRLCAMTDSRVEVCSGSDQARGGEGASVMPRAIYRAPVERVWHAGFREDADGQDHHPGNPCS